MLIIPHTLSLITTMRCTASCDHCCFGCSPRNTDAIPSERLRDYIVQAADIPSIKVVVFTGGECFLLGSDLDKAVRTASEHSFVTRVVSNGFWAGSLSSAKRRLDGLRRAGLKEVNFSTGDSHARYVSPDYVKNGAVAAVDLGMTVVIACEVFEGSRFDLEQFIGSGPFCKHVESGAIMLRLSPWMKFGGRKKLGYSEKYLDLVKSASVTSGACRTVLRVVAITATEQLVVCCGLTVAGIEEMHLGSLRHNTIREVLDRTPDDFIKIWLSLYGPETIIRYAKRLDPSIEAPTNMAHICDVCRYMYQHPRIREVVAATPPANLRDIVSEYAQSHLSVNRTKEDADTVPGLLQRYARNNEIRAMHKIAVETDLKS